MSPRFVPTKLVDYPWVVVRIGCGFCGRAGRYRLARLAARYGPEQDLPACCVNSPRHAPGTTNGRENTSRAVGRASSTLNRDNLLRQADEICALVNRLPRKPLATGQRFPTPYLTVMDWGHDERDYAAGHSDRAPRLADNAWAGMVANIRAIAELARDRHGVRAVVHPHAGGYIEFADEIERIAADVPAHVAGFCLDTGHAYYAGMDPVALLGRYADRLDYIHFKDIDASVFESVIGERIRF